MVTFKSIIAFDAETTSLPIADHNTTKITELAFLGCEVEHLRNTHVLPRVLHKLVLLFNPYKPIHPEASKISGLSNELLVNVKPFREEDVVILKEFISRLPSPVCIVAHNGDNFDFPILRRAFEKVNKELQNNVYCADSLKAFRSLLLGNANDRLTTYHHSDGEDSCAGSTQVTTPDPMRSNETTPKQQRTKPFNSLKPKNVSRDLFPDDDALFESAMTESNVPKTYKVSNCIPKSFKLKDIYFFYYGNYFTDSHRAEEDSKALLSCIMRCEGFFKWINENAVIFNSVLPLF